MGAGRERGRWSFLILFSAQTLGATVVFWYGIPHYRAVLADPAVHEAELKTLLWALPSITLMQLGYWYSFRIRPPLPRLVQPVLGHVVLCLAQSGYVLASGVFTLVFLVPRSGFSMPIARYVVTILGMFSIFCYALELERLGRALLAPVPRKQEHVSTA